MSDAQSTANGLRSPAFLTAQASFGPVVLTGLCGERQPCRECRLGDEAVAAFSLSCQPGAVAGGFFIPGPRDIRVRESVVGAVSQARSCMAAASRVVIRASSVISAWLQPSRASLITELRARSIFLRVFLPAAVTLSTRWRRSVSEGSLWTSPRSCRRVIWRLTVEWSSWRLGRGYGTVLPVPRIRGAARWTAASFGGKIQDVGDHRGRH
jgi:hypothetical protein